MNAVLEQQLRDSIEMEFAAKMLNAATDIGGLEAAWWDYCDCFDDGSEARKWLQQVYLDRLLKLTGAMVP